EVQLAIGAPVSIEAEMSLPVVTTVRSSCGLWMEVAKLFHGEFAGTPICETVPLQPASARPINENSAAAKRGYPELPYVEFLFICFPFTK
ncbi:MAG TPA: hypothetical protein VN783_12170, partial [Thermoanaerobaculia bacterium]|nr:hypothetical protein [Thermoanaerobaculia bacterium]